MRKATDTTAPATKGESTPTPYDWGLLGLLVLMGGGSFAGIKFGVATAEPAIVAFVRLWLAAIMLLIYAYATGRRLPAIFTPARPARLSREWGFMLACGLTGYAIPFMLFPMALQSVDSMLGGIYMAFMPLGTAVMVHFFADEPLTRRKIIGFCLGTTGVIFLLGPAALANIGGSDVRAQLLLLLAVNCYSVYAVLTRRAPPIQARSFAAGLMLVAALMSTPLAVMSGQDWSTISLSSWSGMIFLGIFPTGLGAILIIHLIRHVGAGFTAMSNFVTPVVAVVLGMALFSEPLKATFMMGLVAILAGLAVSQPAQISGTGQGLQWVIKLHRMIRPRK